MSVQAFNDKSEAALSQAIEIRANPAFDFNKNEFDIQTLWAGEKNEITGKEYNRHRIPGIVVTKKVTIIAYNEARMPVSDWADMDIFIQRSTDYGETWEDPIYLAECAGVNATTNYPVIIVGDDNTLHFIHAVEYGVGEKGDVIYRKSMGDGLNIKVSWILRNQNTEMS